MDLRLAPLSEEDFEPVVDLGNLVHGQNYLRTETINKIYGMSIDQGLCCSYVLYDRHKSDNQLIGFRLTYAPGLWVPDQWCSGQIIN